jgi:ABC-type sugar transport system ATPase subunit
MREVITGGATVLFVSHNLKSIAEFCHRCVLLEHGQIVTSGATQEVISSYLNRSRSEYPETAAFKAVVISKVTVRNAAGECLRFESGEKAWIDIEVTASKRCTKLSVSLYVTDEQYQSIFDTSTERLGYGNFALEAGEVFTCTFELQLNLANGAFNPSILVYRYDTQTEYDRWAPATTIYVSSKQDVRGAAHCFPQVIRQEIHAASDGGLAVHSRHSSTGEDSELE